MSAILPRVPPRWFPGINAQLPIAGGLVYACPLNEGRGNNIANYAGGQYGLTSTATPGQLTWAPTQIGTAVRATNLGTNFFFQLGTEGGQGSNQFSDVLTDHSWSVWVYLIGGVTQCYLLGYTTPNGAAINVVYNSGTSQLQFTPGGGVYTTITGFTTDTWHHLCLVQHQTSYTIYLDSIAAATAAWPSGTGEYASGEVTILGISGNTTWNGYVSNFNFWQRPLSLGEVASMYNDPWALYEPPKDFGLPLRASIFNYTGSGGVLAGGAGTNTEVFANPATNGGVLAGGAGTNTEVFANPATNGGVLAGGQELDSVVIGTGGGVLAGGTGTNTEYYANPATNGGVLAGGAASVTGLTNDYGSGGVLAGGSATNTEYFANPATNGGVLAGGSAGLSDTEAVFGSGGVLAGGSASITTVLGRSMQGGIVISGRQWRYRKVLKVPQGKVIEDLNGKTTLFAFTLDPTHV